MMDAFNDGMIEGKQVTYSDCKSVALMENSMPLWDSVGKKKKKKTLTAFFTGSPFLSWIMLSLSKIYL